MRPLKPFVVFAFDSTRIALAAESALMEAGLTVRPMPLPPQRGGLCGIALRLPPEEERAALAALEERSIRIAARDEIEDF
jgi:hypothetical protein